MPKNSKLYMQLSALNHRISVLLIITLSHQHHGYSNHAYNKDFDLVVIIALPDTIITVVIRVVVHITSKEPRM